MTIGGNAPYYAGLSYAPGFSDIGDTVGTSAYAKAVAINATSGVGTSAGGVVTASASTTLPST